MQPSLYRIAKSLEALKETPFKKERELQHIFEANLSRINLLIVPVQKSKSAGSVKPITQKNKEYKSVVDEIKVYTEEDFLLVRQEGNRSVKRQIEHYNLGVILTGRLEN